MICRCLCTFATGIVIFAVYFAYKVYSNAPADVQTTITILEETEIDDATDIMAE
jgi:hypothetical protein